MPIKQVIRKGSRGEAVKELQAYLNKLDSVQPKLTVDGIFGSGTDKAVKQFQKGAGLLTDGVVGQRTWNSLAQVPSSNVDAPMENFQPQAVLADIAKQYIGVAETGDNLAGDSKALLAIFKADTLKINGKTDGYPWCAAFVSYCVQKLCKQSTFFSGLIPPREASVNRLLTVWAKGNHCLIFTNKSSDFKPQKGDIVVFTFSHVGIVEEVKNNTLVTVEGNTNEAGSREGTMVARKTRAKSIVRSYIRLPVSIISVPARLKVINGVC